MSDTARGMEELSEYERLEFNRREDVALYGVLPAAVKLFKEKSELEKAKNDFELKRDRSHWHRYRFLYVLVVGIGSHFFLAGGPWGLNYGTIIVLFACAYIAAEVYEQAQLHSQLNKCAEKLSELEVMWNSVAPARARKGTFEDMSKFADTGRLNFDDYACFSWYVEQRTWILVRVCGWEKGQRVGDELTRQDTKGLFPDRDTDK